MKKIVYIFLLAVAIIFLAVRNDPAKKKTSETTKTSALKEIKIETESPSKTPQILFMVDKKRTASQWWSYKQEGC